MQAPHNPGHFPIFRTTTQPHELIQRLSGRAAEYYQFTIDRGEAGLDAPLPEGRIPPPKPCLGDGALFGPAGCADVGWADCDAPSDGTWDGCEDRGLVAWFACPWPESMTS